MSYNSDKPPEYIKDVLREYNLEVDECGYIRGSWVTVKSGELGSVKFKLSPPTKVEVRKGYRGKLPVRIPIRNGIGLHEKNEIVREQINNLLLGYDSLKKALENADKC